MQDELDKVKSKEDAQNDCLTCDKCHTLELKIFELNQVICNYDKATKCLDDLINGQCKTLSFN